MQHDQRRSTDVTVVGTGTIGSACATTLLSAGYTATVWNRTTARTASATSHGATALSELQQAVEASPLVLVFLVDYAVVATVLSQPDVASALAGRTLIVYTTGSPQEARELEQWAQSRGIAYLDGVIGCYPRQLGTPAASAYYAGPKELFVTHEPLLRALGGEVDYLGAGVGAPAVLEQTELVFFYSAALAFMQMVAMGKPEGVEPDAMLAHLKRRIPVSEEAIERFLPRILHGQYDAPESSINVDVHAVRGLVDECRRLGLDASLPEFLLSRLEAAAPRYGDCDLAALFEFVRPR